MDILSYKNGYNKGYADALEDKWKSVKNPPETYRDEYGELIPFLVYCKGMVYPFRAMYDGKNWRSRISELKITYWMPLPIPPKGE